ncbi:UbiA family prenyltransferase, partial [Nocardia tengchongensis]
MGIGQQPGGAHGSSGAVLADRVTGSGPLAAATRRVLAYIALTKPRVIELLLVATIPTMLLASRGEVEIRLILVTLFGGWMGAASANTLNCVADADIDKVMK